MAVRFDASGDRLYRTANLPGIRSFTASGWARLSVDRNDYSCLFTLYGGSNEYIFATDSDGTTLRLYTTSFSSGGFSLTVGQPFFWACGSDGSNSYAAFRPVGSNTLQSYTHTLSANSATSTMVVGTNFYGEWWNGEVSNVKVWDRLLSPSELLAESFFERPQYPDSLNVWWPAHKAATAAADLSGNGRDATIGGSIADADRGINLWAPRRRIILPATAGGFSGSLSATESGADTASIAGAVSVQGALSVTESGSDTSAISGSVLISGSLAVTETGSDTAAIVGGSVATGDLNATETGSDTAAVSGVVLVQGALSASEVGGDTASASGAVLVSGALAVTESGADTAAISGVVLVQGSMAVTESGSDTFAATGSLSGGVNGSLNAQESGTDTFAASGAVVVSGSLAASEAGADSAAISGVVAVSGALTVSESGSDQFAADGIASVRTGSMDAVEQGGDTALILGEGAEPTQSSPHGFVITDTAPKLWWKRKPKALDEEEAQERVEKLVRVVERVARKQVEEEKPAPAKERKREVREAISPLVEEMPGFDWMAVYRTILIELESRKREAQAREQAAAEIARIRAIEQDDEDALLLLMSF